MIAVALILTFITFALSTVIIIPIVPKIKNAFEGFQNEKIATFINSFGVEGLFVAYGMQIISTLSIVFPIATIPLVTGALYGVPLGMIVSVMGIVTANYFSILLARRFDGIRRIFVSQRMKKRFSFIETTKRPCLVIFIIYLMPIIANGILPYVASYSKISSIKYAGVIAIASAPTFLIWSYIGNNLILGHFFGASLIGAIYFFIFMLLFIFRNNILKALKRVGG